MQDIIILSDTREQHPFIFENESKVKSGYCTKIITTEITTIDAGDYTIKGYEDIVRIERKASLCELMGNMIPIQNKERFERELEKLKNVKHKYIIVESSLSNEVLQLGIPQMRYPVPTSRVLKWLSDLELEYDIKVKFCGDAAKRQVRYIFDSIVRKYGPPA